MVNRLYHRLLNHRFTASEIRGIILVVLGLSTLVFYYSWWFTEARLTSPWLFIGFVIALAYGAIQIVGNWILYLATHYRETHNARSGQHLPLSVDIFITACGEPYPLIERALSAACAVRGDHSIWLLDDGNDPVLARMAARLGVGYLTRRNRKDAKAGNVNAALSYTTGDVIVIFDIDHAPKPDFLEKTLSHFADANVGFVQVMLTFANGGDSWVAEAAADSSLDFYNPTSIGTDGMRSATLVGSNALIRRQALDSIGGYQPGLAEDLATSIALHGEGWRSVYIVEPLAPGFAPPDLAAWFTQQLKWARGVFELLLTAYPYYFSLLKPGQKLSYAVRMTYYWIGPVVGIHLLLTLIALLKGTPEALAGFEQYLVHLSPLAAVVLLIRHLALRRWRYRSLNYGLQWKAMALVFATWPIYTLAWIMAVLRLPLSFRPTPKTASGTLNPLWLLPQVVATLLLIVGLGYSFFATGGQLFLMAYGFAVVQVVTQLLTILNWIRSTSKPDPAVVKSPLRQTQSPTYYSLVNREEQAIIE